ncbi:hypothetical protein GYMLUDRAFT_786894 [Collybiopsis luxurians FD-317 M1]|nr:hypothetical protein GYMLUDRAFT_786894 [Collybiopsis luxurians FD-317 M1]
MRQQPQRPDSPSEHFTMYTEFEPDKKSALNGYHRSSFTSIPNATRPSKHHTTPSSTMPSTNPTIYRDAAPPAFHPDAYGPAQPFVDPSRPNFSAPFALNEPFPSYNKPSLPSQPHSLPHAVNPHPVSMSSQTPYGPHLATNNVSMSGNAGHSSAGNAGNPPSQEDISTIFVVGFPDDMQEREFQNMFTFCAGFEAATLKIPNKEYTAYGISGATNNPPAAPPPGLQNIAIVRAQAAMNDPYNLVTMNQGGVVVDGGRDGTMTSWPTVPMDDSYYPSGFIGGLVPGVGGPANSVTLGPNPNPSASGPVAPRKQIIGFAKFRTREAAMEARDVLQGRRVDIEKGSVLKAEMAKKNLHTKRGVTANGNAGTNIGPVNGGLAPSGNLNAVPNAGVNGTGFPGNPAPSQYDKYAFVPAPGLVAGEIGGMSARERELGTLGAMGFLSAGSSNASGSSGATALPSSSKDLSKLWDDEGWERERKIAGVSSVDESSGPIISREGGRRRSEAKDEKQPLRRGSGSAFEAFHSVPVGFQTSLVSPPLPRAKPYALTPLAQDEGTPGPWDQFPASNPPSSVNGHSRTSPASSVTGGSSHSKDASRDDEDVHTNPEMELEDPNLTAKEIDVAQIARAIGSMAVSSNAHMNGTVSGPHAMNGSMSQGNTSPQLPSPSSGSGTSASTHSGGISASAALSSSSSSSSLRHAQPPCPPAFAPQNNSMLSSTLPGLVSGVDQNPPINTLYVGNLPISPPPLGCPPDILEESLRELFRTRPGFRRLSFKQKSTGPMCFVEFEDVNAATRTMNELYGNTLNGLVKGGGIRLSYSKNPLGVRTPTSANGPGPGLQQQLLQHQQGRDDRERGDKFGYGGAQALSPTPHHPSSNHRLSHPHEYMISPPPPRFAGTSTTPNMSFGNFSSSFRPVGSSHVSVGSASSNYLFGTANSSLQGAPAPGVGYRADTFGDVQGQGPNMAFSPFDSHLDHPQMPQVSPLPMQPNSNQNQNF